MRRRIVGGEGRSSTDEPDAHVTGPAAGRARPLLPRGAWIAALAIAVLSLVLRAAPLSRESLDDDETWSWNAVVQPFGAMIQTVREDKTHPPLYYLLLKPYSLVAGTSDAALRAPSVAAGAATSALATLAAAALTGSAPAGLVAGAIHASLDKQVYFGQQLRSYALYSLLVLCTMCTVALALRRPGDRRLWAAIGALALLSTQTHFLAVTYLAAAGLVLLATPSLRRLVPRFLLVLLPAAAALAAWVAYVVPYVRARGLGNIAWIPRPDAWSVTIAALRHAGLADDMVGGPAGRAHLAAGALALAAGAAVAIPVVLRTLRRERHGVWEARCIQLLAAAVLVPAVLLLLPSLPPLRRHLFVDRHLLPGHAMWAILVGVGAHALARRRRGLAWTAAAVAVAMPLFVTLERSRYPRRAPYREAAAVVERMVPAGDSLRVSHYHVVGGPLNHYLRRYPPGRRFPMLPRDPARLLDEFWLVHQREPTFEWQEADLRLREDYVRSDSVVLQARPDVPWGIVLVKLRRVGRPPA